MLRNKKILITGPTGQIAEAICKRLAPDNDVWGISRFSDAAARQRVEGLGVRTRQVDLAAPDFTGLPTDFDHVLHLAAFMDSADDFDLALRVSAIGTGHLMSHFRSAHSVLIMSTASVYRPHDDPEHLYVETDPLGDVALPITRPTYSISKIAEEAVAKFCAEEFNIPTIIGRMNIAYGLRGGWPARHLEKILTREPIVVRWDPIRYSPIHEDDITRHLVGLLSAAQTEAKVVNFCGDVVVSAQEWCAYLGELADIEPEFRLEPLPGGQRSVACDATLRCSLTGPDRVHWREGVREVFEARMANWTAPS